MNKKQLSNKTVVELKEICKKNKISGYSKLRKNEIIELILKYFKKVTKSKTHNIKEKYLRKSIIEQTLSKYNFDIKVTKGYTKKLTRFLKKIVDKTENNNLFTKYYNKLIKMFNKNLYIIDELCNILIEV